MRDEPTKDFGPCCKCVVPAIATMGKVGEENHPAYCGACLEAAGGPKQAHKP